MIFIPNETIDKFIQEDVPYIDLTTFVFGFGDKPGSMEYFTREDGVLCGTEEVLRVMNNLNVNVRKSLPSGTVIKAGDTFLRANGKAGDLHMAWKVCQNIFDHCSGIATKTRRMVDEAQKVNPDVIIVTTRKGFPGTKALSIKSVLAGGAFPHRLGLSETVLVFRQHINFLGGLENFIEAIPAAKLKLAEKKLIVEADNSSVAMLLAKNGVDGIQFDKLTPKELSEAVPLLRSINPNLAILAAGGINETNVSEYAASGVDVLVTSDLYHAKPLDIGVRINAD